MNAVAIAVGAFLMVVGLWMISSSLRRWSLALMDVELAMPSGEERGKVRRQVERRWMWSRVAFYGALAAVCVVTSAVTYLGLTAILGGAS